MSRTIDPTRVAAARPAMIQRKRPVAPTSRIVKLLTAAAAGINCTNHEGPTAAGRETKLDPAHSDTTTSAVAPQAVISVREPIPPFATFARYAESPQINTMRPPSSAHTARGTSRRATSKIATTTPSSSTSPIGYAASVAVTCHVVFTLWAIEGRTTHAAIAVEPRPATIASRSVDTDERSTRSWCITRVSANNVSG